MVFHLENGHARRNDQQRTTLRPPNHPRCLLSAQTLAKRLAVSVRTLWRLRSSGKLPEPVRLGGAVRWRTADIDAWVAAGCPELPGRKETRGNIPR